MGKTLSPAANQMCCPENVRVEPSPVLCGASIHLYVHTVWPRLPRGPLPLPLQLGYRSIQIQLIEMNKSKSTI